MADDEIRLGEPLGANAIHTLIRQMGRMPDDLRKRLRPAMREAAKPVLADAKQRASWSSRIPASLRISTSFTRKRAGVSIVSRAAIAPHARAYEGVAGNTFFRHPVFDRDVWVQQRTRPFLFPAADLHGRSVTRVVDRTVNEAARAAGFKE